MLVKLFDVQNDKIVPTEHCYAIKDLKAIMDNYPENYLNIYLYLFYCTCPNPDLNPFFNYEEDLKEEIVLEQIKADFNPEDDLILKAKELCEKLYETPTSRAYKGIKMMLDKLGKYMETTSISAGRDGNGPFLLNAAKQFQDIRQSFKGVEKDLLEEQQSSARGGAGVAYDQK